MGQKVIVKSLDKKTWSGFSRFPKCHDHSVAKAHRGGYETGLTKDQEAYLEKELGLKAGELARHSDYWKEYAVVLTDRDLVLDMDNPRDILDLSILKMDPRVSNSVNERSNWPKAEYEIYDAEEDAQNENAKINEEARAMAKFVELTPQEKRNYLKLLGKGAGSMSDAIVTNLLFKIAKDDHAAFNRISDLPNYKTRILLYDLISEGYIKIKGGHYFYDQVAIGHGEESACQHLDDPHNQELKIMLAGKLQSNLKQEKKENKKENK